MYKQTRGAINYSRLAFTQRYKITLLHDFGCIFQQTDRGADAMRNEEPSPTHEQVLELTLTSSERA